MDYNAFEILGLTSSATKEEAKEKYENLRQKYLKDRFLPGEEGEKAAEKLQELDVAYRDVLAAIDERGTENDKQEQDNYTEIQDLLKQGSLDEAQTKLDERTTRDAEWHYMQSILFYKRSWFLESKKQLELACEMDPENKRYKQSLEKLTKILASNTISPEQMRTTSRPIDEGPNMDNGNGTCTGSACADCLLCNACCNCAQCMGGGC